MAAFSRQAESSYSIIRWTSGFWIERCAVCAGAQYSGCDRRSADTHLETFRRLLHPTEGEIVSIRRPIRIDGGRDGSDLPAPRHSVSIAAKCWWSLATTTLRSPRWKAQRSS